MRGALKGTAGRAIGSTMDLMKSRQFRFEAARPSAVSQSMSLPLPPSGVRQGGCPVPHFLRRADGGHKDAVDGNIMP